jgi:hypothetical protein
VSILDAFLEGAAASYAAECARGEHDSQCEYDPRGFFLCHCKKRRRVAAGVTEPPADELYFPPPTCPRCRVDLEYDEGWRCDSCHLRWREDGTHAEFTDEYGDDLAQRSAAWKASRHLDADSEGVGS